MSVGKVIPLARRFLYLVAALIVLVLTGALALRLFPGPLERLAFVPSGAFVAPPPLAANAYADAAMWIARPDLTPTTDPAHWRPQGGPATTSDGRDYAVFFVHPTSYLDKAEWNAPLDDRRANTLARAYVSMMGSAFDNGQLWAPRYRQAAMGAFLTQRKAASAAIDIASRDVMQAFDNFIARQPPERPIVLVGHGQGARLIERILRERVASRPLARRIVAAYLIGWPVSIEHDLTALGLPACVMPDQAGCIMSWQSYGPDGDPGEMSARYAHSIGFDGHPRGTSAMLCTNPLTGGEAPGAPAAMNQGTLVPDNGMTGGHLVAHRVGARCNTRGLLMLDRDVTLGPDVLPGDNYAVYDIPLFWANVRADVIRRARGWATR